MSMNIYITASRKVTFKKKDGKRGGSIQTVKFNAWQTPTEVTRSILSSKDPKAAYIEWIARDRSTVQEEPMYAADDIWCEGPVIGVNFYNAGKEHIDQFLQWCDDVQEEGYVIIFGEI